MTQQASELKPCPWCGGTNITKADDGENEWLICVNCEATGPYSPDDYAADLSIEQAWNLRADLAPSPEAFQQMREALENVAAMLNDATSEAYFLTSHTVGAKSTRDARYASIRRARAALKAAEGET